MSAGLGKRHGTLGHSALHNLASPDRDLEELKCCVWTGPHWSDHNRQEYREVDIGLVARGSPSLRCP
ncbi:unnamed protein product [Protopolystoma xenopodis]|uniref:Uncharacterized protein n=1 Tax=Protopolystoma xenopodis TaxID=117903 RepID=A0A448WEP3_9PLAT|nr:unnamed protein product [Protopolystoma xenopodis]